MRSLNTLLLFEHIYWGRGSLRFLPVQIVAAQGVLLLCQFVGQRMEGNNITNRQVRCWTTAQEECAPCALLPRQARARGR